MRTLFVLSALLFAQIFKAQNLIVNPSFEVFSPCPTGPGLLGSTVGWSSPQNGSPDLFNACATSTLVTAPKNYWGWQMPRTGNVYAGANLIYYNQANFREYLQGSLVVPLTSGVVYYFEMYVSKCNQSQFATDMIGVHFSTNSLSTSGSGPYSFSPLILTSPGIYFSDTLNWVPISATFTATGSEQYFIVGNYRPDLSTSVITTNSSGTQPSAYMYYDDFSLVPLSNVGIKETIQASNARIIPSLFKEELKLSSSKDEEFEICFYDPALRLIEKQNIRSGQTIQASHLPRGLLFYTLFNSNNEKISSGKLIGE